MITRELSAALRTAVSDAERLARLVQRALHRSRDGHLRRRELQAGQRALRRQAYEAREGDRPALLNQLHAAHSQRRALGDTALPDADAPYFAHLRLQLKSGVRDVLLGDRTLLEPRLGVTVVRWQQSPLARVFFEHEQGDDYDLEADGRRLRGHILLRHRVTFDRGVLIRVSTPEGTAVRDRGGTWTPDHEGGVDLRARGCGFGTGTARRGATRVTGQLDAAQYRAITRNPRQSLVVLGSAGSGKTTVALHRLSVLAGQASGEPALGVVVPTPGLARLTRLLLGELELRDATVDTFDDWVVAQARRAVPDLPRRVDTDSPAAVIRFKRHPALLATLVDAARAHNLPEPVSGPDDEPPRCETLGQLRALLLDRDFGESVVRASDGELTAGIMEEVIAHTRQQCRRTSRQRFAHVSPERLETLDGRDLDADTPDAIAGTLDLEDHALLWVLREHTRRRGRARRRSRYGALVLDEAQELADVELDRLGSVCRGPGGLVVAGDSVQQLDPGHDFRGWAYTLAALGVGDHQRVELEITYRCTAEIARFGQRVLGEQAPQQTPDTVRAGAPVLTTVCANAGERTLHLRQALDGLLDDEPEARVAIVARDERSARQCHTELSSGLDCTLVAQGAFTFAPGICVTPVDDVKGLEFDYVIVPDASPAHYPDTPEARRALHVAATRAIHQLWVLSLGSLTSILGQD